MLNLSPKKLKPIATIRGIKDYKSMFEDRLLSALKASESLKESGKNFDGTKPKTNFFKPRIEKIGKNFIESRHKFSKSKINEIRKSLDEIENEKNLFAPKIKETEKNLLELEKNIFKLKKYYDYDDIEYKGTRNVRNLFDLSIDKDYYKPIITNSVNELYYNLNKISLSRGGSSIDSPEWLKNKKATINPKNNDDKCIQYAVTVSLHYLKLLLY